MNDTAAIIETPVHPKCVEVLDYRMVTGMKIHNCVSIQLSVDGVRKVDEQDVDGNGPVNALVRAIQKIVPHELEMTVFKVHGVGVGSKTMGSVQIVLSKDGEDFESIRLGNNSFTAIAEAYVEALNKYLHRVHNPT